MTTILIVEDDVAVAKFLAELLEDEGYTIQQAVNGRVALTMLEQAMPHLILTDMMMPVMNGGDLCRMVQTSVLYQSIPLVIMSAAPINLDDCTPAAVLPKPFEISMLLALIERILDVSDI